MLHDLSRASSESLPSLPPCGALELDGDAVLWRVWAPTPSSVELVLYEGDRPRYLAMQHEDRGYYSRMEEVVFEGQRYAFRLDGGNVYPDPCSRWQPDGPHRASAVVRTSQFGFSDGNWLGLQQQDLVIYELHVGTFTRAGTFDAVIPRLKELADLGITAIELMPIGQFPGTRNWGYDGVHPFAPQNSYGGPPELARLVDACHRHGLAILLDVVYNHCGPEGNYLARYGPYFTDRYTTPWGPAVNFDGPGSDCVRQIVLDNVRMWLADYRFDGLRLDAVHTIYDFSARHILADIEQVARQESRRQARPLHIIAESDLNDPRLLWPAERGGYDLSAQWSDDFHHAAHAYLTGEQHSYYLDFGAAEQVCEALIEPFLYRGQYSRFRDCRHGSPPVGLAGDRFVCCLQNHDQIGNRPAGERLTRLLTPEQLTLAASLLLLSPYVPLIFMGEEYGEEAPFPFFCAFTDADLVESIRRGRQADFAFHGAIGTAPDPLAEETFARARLSWSWPEGSFRAGLRQLYADLLRARRTWPELQNFARPQAAILPQQAGGPVVELVRHANSPQLTLHAFFNLSKAPAQIDRQIAAAGNLTFSSQARRYGGQRGPSDEPSLLHPYECLVFRSSERAEAAKLV